AIGVVSIVVRLFSVELRSRCNREHSQGTSASVDDLERRRNHDCTSRWKSIEIAEARKTELAVAMHRRVIRERWIERAGLPCIGADSLNADAEHVAILREQL